MTKNTGRIIKAEKNRALRSNRDIVPSGRQARNLLPGSRQVRSTVTIPSRREAANALEGEIEF